MIIMPEILEELKKSEERANLRKKKGGLEREKLERILFKSMKVVQRMMKKP